MGGRERQALLIADLSYGDAGKGSLVDYLTRLHGAHSVVRYNGGAQAAHNVVDNDGRHHTFAQFGSGMFTPGVRTHLSRFMLVNPLNMLKEEQHLSSIGITDAFQRTSIDEDALIITPFQQAANRLQELARDEHRHGSCGMGIGETMADFLAYGSQVLFARDLPHRSTVRTKLRFLHDMKLGQLEQIRDQIPDSEQATQELRILHDPEVIEDCVDFYHYFAGLAAIVPERYFSQLLAQPGTIIFEGAQGILLDEWYGFHPYTTWSTTTLKNAEQLLAEEDYAAEITRIGVMRAYATRHGLGPFVTEDAQLSCALPDAHNENNLWQRQFRVGYLDLVATRYALAIAGLVDYLAVTNLDRLAQLPAWNVCDAYTCHGSTEETLSDYFVMQGASITQIKPPQHPDLARQERLTQLLWHCRPSYHTVHPRKGPGGDVREARDVYLAHIEQSLQRPIAVTSYGPTASQKWYDPQVHRVAINP
ncbi:MAG TPA: adenylosuccinate synthetase [Ktedonobacterales bacterium]|nr:adenylosuccinate synthetase [Ktedonobacterales bacterium]